MNRGLLTAGNTIGQPLGWLAIGFYSPDDIIKRATDPKSVPGVLTEVIKAGDIKYKDIGGADGKPDGFIDANDRIPIGKTGTPNYTLGLQSVYATRFRPGPGIPSSNWQHDLSEWQQFLRFPGQWQDSADSDGRWTPATAETASYPRLSSKDNLNNYQFSSFWQRDGSFIKLRSAEIGYTMPKRLTQKIHLNTARFFITGTNLLSIDHIEYGDPESLSGYPGNPNIDRGGQNPIVIIQNEAFMKKNIYILVACALVGFTACQKLDREFVTTIGRNEIDQSFANVGNLLNAIYFEIPDGTTYIQGGPAMMASASDEAEFTSETNPVQSFNSGSWNAINNPDQVWGNYYRGIRKVNQFLQSTGKVNLDPWKLDPSPSAQAVYVTNLATIKRWSYEARLLRAYFYFELVKRYGGVPILNEALPIDGDFSKVERNRLDTCINFITRDVIPLAAQLPLNTATCRTRLRTIRTSYQVGRIGP